jgi:hypothetical protein
MPQFPKTGETLAEVTDVRLVMVRPSDIIWVFSVRHPKKAYLIGRLVVGESLRLSALGKASVLRAIPGSEEPVKDISLRKASVQLEFTESGGNVFGTAFTESGGQVKMGDEYVRCIQSGRELTPASAAALEDAWRTQSADHLARISAKESARDSLTKPTRKLTIFSWGYWGWGSSAAKFVKAADAVEGARGYVPPLFVDVRLQRSVRAANFNGNAFKELVGEKRYRWMNKLGNVAIADRSLKKLTIKDPHEAETLLDLAIDCDHENRRVLFFCACEVPNQCHRYEVGKLLLKAAKSRGISMEIVEWPGGDAQEIRESVSEEVRRKLQKGAQMLPLPVEPDLVKYAGLPWGSVAGVVCGSSQLFFMTGPAKYARGGWGLPVYTNDLFEEPNEPKGIATDWLHKWGFEPRFSMIPLE